MSEKKESEPETFQKMRMADFILFNPKSNPPSSRKKKGSSSTAPKSMPLLDENDDINEMIDEKCKEVGAARVKIDENGEIIIDEESLVIECPSVAASRKLIESKPILVEDEFSQNPVKRNGHGRKAWSREDTLKFYKALNTIGTDFYVMTRLFPGRDRNQLKSKFKLEEKRNAYLIKKALLYPLKFDLNELEDDMEREKIKSMDKNLRKKSNKKNTKTEKGLRGPFGSFIKDGFLEVEIQQNEDEIALTDDVFV